MCLDRIVPVYYNFTGEPREAEEEGGSQIRNLAENIQMYLLRLQNIFVKIAKCICQNGTIYLSKWKNIPVYHNFTGEAREEEGPNKKGKHLFVFKKVLSL